jgi:hypothetical protein
MLDRHGNIDLDKIPISTLLTEPEPFLYQYRSALEIHPQPLTSPRIYTPWNVSPLQQFATTVLGLNQPIVSPLVHCLERAGGFVDQPLLTPHLVCPLTSWASRVTRVLRLSHSFSSILRTRHLYYFTTDRLHSTLKDRHCLNSISAEYLFINNCLNTFE